MRDMCVILGLIIAAPGVASGQQTTVYGYDALGRLVNAGSSSSDTTLYIYDPADNRVRRRCCQAIGGVQVFADGFDPYFYLQTYSDIRSSGMDPYYHWVTYGYAENRLPNRYFSTAWYKSTYGLGAGVNPLTHYHTIGWSAGYNPSPEFSTTIYHSTYPDTASLDPLQHFLRWGYGEGRSAFPVP